MAFQPRKIEKDPAKREREVLRFWEENRIFERSLENTGDKPKFVFYEGPPTANGTPHFAHLLARLYKDLFPRYKTMRGYYVPRKAGWDCHGLPVEIEVEKELGIKSKPEILSYGVEKFVEKCKESVRFYIGKWEEMIRRMGFWIDLEHPYVTMTDDYIETLWWAIKRIHEQGLLYRGHKVLPYCPRCGTPLSSHEVAQGYRTTADPSVFVLMPLVEDPEVKVLVWTTTPWTLPSNVALAIDPAAVYAEVRFRGERLILAVPRLQEVLGEEAEVLREFRGEELLGKEYEPLYPLVAGEENAYRIVGAEFVSMEEGTGVVHIAPAFGEEDYQLGKEENLPFVQPVDLSGKFTDAFPLARGLFVKEADPLILEDLRKRGRLFRAGTIEHEYPFCWRCDTPLLYYALDSWFIATTAKKEEIIAENETVEWYPEHVGRGRFGDFLHSMRDWALSRDRFWGTPLPVWECAACGRMVVIGSRAELTERAVDPELARRVELHRPYIDRVKLRCDCGGEMERVPHVLDTWFDSGAMHTAQWHYPFENRELFRENYPADFICEGLDQTRGWFYTLIVTGVLLHGKTPYKRVLVTGLGLDERGQKMSKSRGNAIDPLPVADRYGADAIRWYLAAESAPWTVRRISLEGVRKARAGFLETVVNCHDFFALYAGIDGFDPGMPVPEERPLLDRWLLSRTAQAVEEVTGYLDAYKVVEACRALERYVDDLSNWYIRLSRPRFWGGEWTDGKLSGYHSLYTALKTLAALIAPFTPFLAEAMWRSLRTDADPESVHLAPWPEAGERDRVLEGWMARVRAVAELGLAARNRAKVKVRQPLRRLLVRMRPGDEAIPGELWELAKEELNVKEIALVEGLDELRRPVLSPNFASLGPRLGPLAPKVATALSAADHAALREVLEKEGKASLRVEGRDVELLPTDVKVSWETAEGFVLIEEGDDAVALDVRLDDELRAEGDLRELIHRIQLARKEAGFEVTDRIELGYEGEIAEIFRRFPERIKGEVLAVSLVEGELPGAEYTVEFSGDEGDRRRDERERLSTKIHGKSGKIYLRRVKA